MLQTVIRLPHEVWGWPLLGWGWVLLVWAAVSLVLLTRMWLRHGMNQETVSNMAVFALIAVAIVLVLPALEERGLQGEPLGLPVRGYGLMLAVALVCGVGWSVDRAGRMGVHPDTIFGLAFWMLACGLLGARGFYVVQYWEEFQRPTIWGTLKEIASYNEGGLVVFGSLVGGMVGFAIFAGRKRLPVLAIADLIVPAMLLGLSLGRIGCLLNGCCFGGACQDSPLALHFPPGSAPYLRQLQQGQLWGVRWKSLGEGRFRLLEVRPKSLADLHGLQPGDVVSDLRLETRPTFYQADAATVAEYPAMSLRDETRDRTISWTRDQMPTASLPTRPAQLMSSLNAAILALLTAAFYPYRPRDGCVFALGLASYSVTRFLLEIIRVDEPGQWGTPFTISQWVAFAMLACAALLTLLVFARLPQRLALPPLASDKQ